VLTERFDKALTYASIVHGGHKRKGTQTPYISHLLAVVSIVLENGGTEDEAIAALLHDAAEDQGGRPRLDDIRARFGDRVAEIVEACSDSLVEDSSKKPEWHKRKELYHRELRAHSDSSFYLVSVADKLHNARSMAQDERQIGEKL
jgi:(p)ppGpp synthase/HD superfamily hydrolase